MRIAYITAGAAGRYCGNCLRDNVLALHLRALGEDVCLVPTYTPIRTDLENASEGRIFFNGLRVFLEQKYEFFRRPRPLLDRLLGNRLLLGWLSRLSSSTNAGQLGNLTVSMLRGEEGHQHKELDELVRWLERDVKPEVVHLSNVLLVGMAARLRDVLRVPVVCGLQAEDSFLDALPDPHRATALELISERGGAVDGLVAVSEYYAERAASRFSLPREKISVVLPGIMLEGHEKVSRPEGSPLTVGYLGRISPEKGLHLLCQAFRRLAVEPELTGLRLEVAGFLANDQIGYAAALRRDLSRLGLGDRVRFIGTVDRREKLTFLAGIDVLAVPTVYPDPKGLSVIEALASGIPVVAPDDGIFPELLEKTRGGLLCQAGDVDSLVESLRILLTDADGRSRMGEAGHREVHDGFSAERMARETLSVYRNLTSGAVL